MNNDCTCNFFVRTKIFIISIASYRGEHHWVEFDKIPLAVVKQESVSDTEKDIPVKKMVSQFGLGVSMPASKSAGLGFNSS